VGIDNPLKIKIWLKFESLKSGCSLKQKVNHCLVGAVNFGLRALFKAMYGEVAFEEFQFTWSVLTDQYHRFIYPSSFL
jgi:hypothetical protein